MFDDVGYGPGIDLGCSPGPFTLAAAMSTDLVELSTAALLDLIAEVERTMSMTAALRARLIVEHARRTPIDPVAGGEQADLEWHREELAAACRISPHEAQVRLDTALALDQRLPLSMRALTDGDLPWAQAVALARHSRDLDAGESAAVERIVLADPRAVSVGEVAAATRSAVDLVRPSKAAAADRDAYELRSVQFWPHDDGTTDLHARLTHDMAATLASALDPLAVSGGPDDVRTARQRRADALLLLASRDGDATDRPRVQLTLLARTDAVRGLADGVIVGPAGSTGTVPVGPDVVRRLTCDTVTAQVHDVTPDGAVGPVVETRRFPDAALRRRLEARDRHCAFPGCPVGARSCHAHHIRHWSRGGPTTDDNILLVCSRHHHAVHEGGWTLLGPPTALRWRDRHGHEYERPPAAATIPPWREPPPRDPPPNGPPPQEPDRSHPPES